MKRFINDIKKYKNYIIYATKSELKSEVTNSYLNWIWLFLEPLCFMLIYTFIAVIVFNSSVQYFAIFVFIGLNIWNFFNKTLVSSVKLISSNKDIVTKVYIPKFILIFVKIGVNTFKMAVSFLLVVLFMIIYQVPISFNVLFFIPLYFVLCIVTFGISSIFMHFGVFIQDLVNLTNIGLRLLFYLTGIFYAISTKVPEPYNEILLRVNPLAYLANDFRNVLIYQTPPDFLMMLLWFVIGISLSMIGIKTIYKYENTYVKVMK